MVRTLFEAIVRVAFRRPPDQLIGFVIVPAPFSTPPERFSARNWAVDGNVTVPNEMKTVSVTRGTVRGFQLATLNQFPSAPASVQ